jgi:hypothetical protein
MDPEAQIEIQFRNSLSSLGKAKYFASSSSAKKAAINTFKSSNPALVKKIYENANQIIMNKAASAKTELAAINKAATQPIVISSSNGTVKTINPVIQAIVPPANGLPGIVKYDTTNIPADIKKEVIDILDGRAAAIAGAATIVALRTRQDCGPFELTTMSGFKTIITPICNRPVGDGTVEIDMEETLSRVKAPVSEMKEIIVAVGTKFGYLK